MCKIILAGSSDQQHNCTLTDPDTSPS